MSTRASALVTILFTDLAASTELLSRAGDEDAQRIFRAHHKLLGETAAAHGGAEVKWLGDGLMAAFVSAADALRCAIAMQQASRRPVGGERLAIRVGLNAGEAFRDEADYFGTPVVVARRLCDRADPGQILCSELVSGLLAGRATFTFASLGPLELKGVPHPVSALEVRYEADATPGLVARLPFVGRQDEIARLSALVEDAGAGHGGLVFLAGEPGIGKTRLTEELIEAAADGFSVLWGHCLEGDWSPPYAPFAEVIESLAGTVPADELRADLGAGGPALAQLVPALRESVPDLPDAVPVQPDEERFRLLEPLLAGERGPEATLNVGHQGVLGAVNCAGNRQCLPERPLRGGIVGNEVLGVAQPDQSVENLRVVGAERPPLDRHGLLQERQGFAAPIGVAEKRA